VEVSLLAAEENELRGSINEIMVRFWHYIGAVIFK
jgi:hypothetical protein